MNSSDELPMVGTCAAMACALEALASKPGNVNRSADFESTTLQDFVVSAIAIAPLMEQARSLRLGELILLAVEATVRWVDDNTNLGLILLLGPLAKAAATSDRPFNRAHVREVLSELKPSDAADVYEAIRLARPGGIGQAEQFDVQQPAPDDLLKAMTAAADHDLIARQYANAFEQVFERVVPWLSASVGEGWPVATAIIQTQIRILAEFPDSLIARKCGLGVAQQASAMAAAALAHAPESSAYLAALAELDFWLRAHGNRRNPGTTADLIGAGLFVCLRNRQIELPLS